MEFICSFYFFFFFKQKTAYAMRISDWSSDVCSSDLLRSEWSLEIDTVRVGAGIVRVRAVNEGALRHNLTVTKAGTFSEIYQTPLLKPGEAVELPLLFAKGEYDLYCAVPGHRNAGMIAYFVVGDAVADDRKSTRMNSSN